ncbi:MAG: ATP-grasp domain-containing protein, partial [Cyanobacteria bacterium P01_F01_bin.42]
EVLVNELAPRTHNSGHLTIEACETSQFEQHLRAIADLPLGPTSMKTAGAVMVNLLGFETGPADYWANLDTIDRRPNTFVHWYHKQESRVGRKLGHVTARLSSPERDVAIATAREIEALWYSS